MPQILLVEDEAPIADTLQYALKTEGFAVVWRTLGKEALVELATGSFDLLIVDVGLPDMTGFELCKQIRRTSDIPLMFLTARSDEIDRVVGLEIGADDYVTKPFSPREVCARVRTILRRARPQPTIQTEVSQRPSSTLQLDSESQRARYHGTALELTRYEFRLLSVLLSRPDRIFSRADLLDRVWGDADVLDRVVDTHIKTLRAKLRAVDPSADPITTHRGLGYSAQFPVPSP